MCFLGGFRPDSTWVRPGFALGPTWSRPGPALVPTWSRPGPDLVPTSSRPGPDLRRYIRFLYIWGFGFRRYAKLLYINRLVVQFAQCVLLGPGR